MDENRFGFIHSATELKVLILYILSRISVPCPREDLTDLTLMTDNGIGYFEFSDCLADLVKTQHITEQDNKYSITKKGIENGKSMETSVPYSVRIRAEKAAATLNGVLSRDSMITSSRVLRQRGGYTLKLALNDGVGEIINMELLCADEKSAKTIEANFRKNAEKIYGKIIGILLEE
ncbi:MAG: DUF4364 family protein [Oscillospiraceae bacterium]|nr:DUF4364 family protein [Oscillospiraceae bacterium]